MNKEEKAIEFVMQFYNITREETIELYMDEVEAYMSLMNRVENDDERSNIRGDYRKKTVYSGRYNRRKISAMGSILFLVKLY